MLSPIEQAVPHNSELGVSVYSVPHAERSIVWLTASGICSLLQPCLLIRTYQSPKAETMSTQGDNSPYIR